MKKSLCVGICAMLLLAVLAAVPAFAQANKEVMAAANPIIDKLTKGMEANNYNIYMEPWSPATKAMLTKDQFTAMAAQMNGQLGKLQSKSFYSLTDSKGYKVVQWKAKYAKAPVDLYLWLFLKNIDGKYYVEGHWVKPQPYK